MLAIVKPAVRGQFLDVGERLAQSGLIDPHLDLFDARIVHEDSAAGEDDELTRTGGVTAFAGEFVDVAHVLPFIAEDFVDDGRFSHTAGSDERHGDPSSEMAAHGFHSLAFERAGDMYDGVGVQLFGFHRRLGRSRLWNRDPPCSAPPPAWPRCAG